MLERVNTMFKLIETNLNIHLKHCPISPIKALNEAVEWELNHWMLTKIEHDSVTRKSEESTDKEEESEFLIKGLEEC